MKGECKKNRCGASAVWLCLVLLLGLTAAGRRAAAADRDADRLFDTAMASYRLERWEEASERFYRFMTAVPMDSRNDQAQFYAARSFHRRRYLNRAVDEYGYVLEDFPDSLYSHLARYYRGRVLIELERAEQGYEDLYVFVNGYGPEARHRSLSEDDIMRELYSGHRDAVFRVADRFLAAGEHERAIAVYMKLPRALEAFRNVVNVRYQLGQYDRILEMIEALEGENRHEAFKYMIEFYAERNAYRRLQEVFRGLLREPEPNRQTDDLVWHTKNMIGRFGQEHLENALVTISEQYHRLARRAEFELASRNWESAGYQDRLELFVIRYRGESPRNINVGHGRDRLSMNDVDQVLRWKGIFQERRGAAEDARNEYRRLDNAAQGHWYVAESYHGQHARDKDLRGAMAEYENIRRLFYSEIWSAMAQWRIASLYRRQEQWDRAEEAYRHVHDRWPDLTASGGKLRHNLGMSSVHFAPAALLNCGDMFREEAMHRYDDAIMSYRNVVRFYPRSDEAPWAIFRTGLCFEHKDDHETAINVFMSLLRQYGRSRAAANASERLLQRYDIPDPEVDDAMDFTDVIGY